MAIFLFGIIPLFVFVILYSLLKIESEQDWDWD